MGNRRHLGTAAAVALCATFVVAASGRMAAQSPPRLVREASLVRQGSFNLPADAANLGFEWGGTAITYNAANGSLYVVGHDWNQWMSEVTIPSLGGTATIIQALADPSEGRGVGADWLNTKIGGSLVHQGQLWFTKYIYYDAEYDQVASHFSRPLSLSTTGQVTGPLTIGSQNPGFVSGYLGNIPSEWQSALGGTVLTGNCCLSILSRTSYGPAVSAWTPGQTTATPLVYYTVDHQTLGEFGVSGSHPAFNGTTRVRGVVFPEGTDSVLFIGRTGTGNYCYGTGAQCGDPVDESQGTHAYPYRLYVWAYNAYDLAAVRAGTAQPWDIVPYAIWDLGVEADNEFCGSAAYDPSTGRIFVSQVNGNGERPLIHVFSVAAAPQLPTLTPSPTSLAFGAVNSGGTLTAQTPAQTVTVTQSGGTGVAWTASANVSWLTIAAADATGTGTGRFSVALNNTGGVLPASGTLTGTITITAAGAQSNPTITVRVTTYPTGVTAAPFGQVDTPVQSATGVQGAIGVSGWTLDDVGVSTVKIYRNCLAFDNQAGCFTRHGFSMVFIGDAAFVAGARPDVEGAFPNYPQPYKAGWGYLMLTNMLPHVTGSRGYGGQGPLTLYAIAADADGRTTLLGRTRLDSTPTTITMANDSIAKPFGAIDTPSQGQTVSGNLANFGWVLTPDGDSVAGAGDILVPTDGSTMNVVVDGVAIGKVAYNQCRGIVGNPVPSGSYCDDDVANIFGNTVPLAAVATRTGNPTRHRNLDVNRAAIGAFAINTTLMTNGLHNIAWGVTDSAGRAEGIGSRNFIVLNTGSDPFDSPAPALAQARAASMLAAPPAVYGAASMLDGLSVATDGVPARTGFDFEAPLETLPADADGVHRVHLPELGRLEVHVGAVTAGYLVANGTLRALPVGSHLDREAGVFTWMPSVGYVGTYRLAFVRAAEQVLVEVTIRPDRVPDPGEGQIRMHLDLPDDGQTVGAAFTVAGWALDPQAPFGSGIGAVHVWAQRRDRPGAAAAFLGTADLGGVRPDVARAFGPQFRAAGFGLTATALPPGVYDLTAYVWNRRTARFEDARTVTVTVR